MKQWVRVRVSIVSSWQDYLYLIVHEWFIFASQYIYIFFNQIKKYWTQTLNYQYVPVLKWGVVSYHAGIGILWFINHHCGVTSKSDFPIGNVWADRQG